MAVEGAGATAGAGAAASFPAMDVAGASAPAEPGPCGFGADVVCVLNVPDAISPGCPGRLSLAAMSGALLLTREQPSKTTMPPMTRT